jgi:hypothetical protein
MARGGVVGHVLWIVVAVSGGVKGAHPDVVGGPEVTVAAGVDAEDLSLDVVGQEQVPAGRVERRPGGFVHEPRTHAGEIAGAGEPALKIQFEEVRILEDRHLLDLGVRDQEPVRGGVPGDARRIGAGRREFGQ